MPTLEERENLLPLVNARETGFSPRSASRVASQRRPRTEVDLDCQHVLRTDLTEACYSQPSVIYRLWLEAGKLPVSLPPARPDVIVNSNVWRNFRRQYSEFLSHADNNHESNSTSVGESVATVYPLTIPAPSRIGDFTFAKFVGEVPLISDVKRRHAVIRQVEQDIAEYKRLQLRTEIRDPPLTQTGKIVPPLNYRSYPRRSTTFFRPPDDLDAPLTEGDGHVDVFGRYVQCAATSPGTSQRCKLEFRRNNPKYGEVVRSSAVNGLHKDTASAGVSAICLPPASAAAPALVH